MGLDYTKLAQHTAAAGEPGYLWMENARNYGRMRDPPNARDYRATGVNPCGEITLESSELCNVVESFPAHHDDLEDYKRTCKFAYLYAKTVTLVPTHDRQTNAVMFRNRRVGLSQSGIVQAMAKHGRREYFQWCDEAYKFVQELDAQYAEWLAVPRSVKTTTTKPSGSVSKLCGSTPGIHYPTAQYYIRRVTFAKDSPMLPAIQAAGYPVEQSVYDPNSVVVEFPVQEKNFLKAESDVSMWEQLENAAQVQAYWADNQVSCTVKFSEAEAADIASALELYETRLKSISFLPHAHGYAQAPEEPITREEYLSRAERVRPLTSFEQDMHEITEVGCDSDVCEIPKN